ncbi:hypothetical protein BUE63_12265 [Bacillus sp. MB353a]|uniref:lactococcin 972 family bacteriocin n=1 Tax=Bacillus sp. MB353a TaxID=1982041 RepID=UPI000B52E65D|nr:lactococcin 972 family bacteriocin [Bacillus sp. MB353a]OWW09890.1 hypothetical protein BUE63_12265 [Bacillus sp. MB353a]
MKKKVITAALSSMLAIGALAPITSSASENWSYGYNKNIQLHYSVYMHSVFNHSSGITVANVNYRSEIKPPGKAAEKHLPYTGPYNVTYQKYIH